MLFKIQKENSRKVIAVLAVFISVLAIVWNTLKSEQPIFIHICLLQIFASILLFIGSINSNRWFFLPWLLTAFLFAYSLVYESLKMWHDITDNFKWNSMRIMLMYIAAGTWFYFINVIYVDFQEMRRKVEYFV